MTHKTLAGWLALLAAVALACDAAVARWYPALTAPGTEATIISALLAFAAAAFGIAAYETRITQRGDVTIMTTQADIDAKLAILGAKIATDDSAHSSVIALLAGVVKEVADLKAQLAAAHPALDLSGFDTLAAALDKGSADLATAVLANTPAPAPAPVEPVKA